MFTPIIIALIPSWISSSLSSLGTFIVGAVGKVLWDRILSKMALKASRIERLQKLKAIIDEVKQLNDVQLKFIDKLNSSVGKRVNQEITSDNKDTIVTDNYDTLTAKEMDLFVTIRGISANSMKRNREELMKWVEENIEFKTNSISIIRNGSGIELSAALVNLELNLNIWQDKYIIWMENPKHPYVLVGDETDFVNALNRVLNVVDKVTDDLKQDKKFLSRSPSSNPS